MSVRNNNTTNSNPIAQAIQARNPERSVSEPRNLENYYDPRVMNTIYRNDMIQAFTKPSIIRNNWEQLLLLDCKSVLRVKSKS